MRYAILFLLLLVPFSPTNGKEESTSFQIQNSETGVFDSSYSTTQDQNRLAFLLHINANVMDASSLYGFEGIYTRLHEDGTFSLFVNKTTASLAAISNASNSDAQSLLSAGMGIGYRFKWMLRPIDSDRLFESLDAFIAYHQFTDNVSSDRYSGPGIKLDYGIHYRTSANIHYGLRYSFNLAEVVREAKDETESRSDRTLALYWQSLAIEIGLYF